MDFGNISTNIIKKGLVFNMDAANMGSYPRTGTTATDTIGNISGTLNGTTFISDNSGVFNFDGVDDKNNFGTILRFDHTSESYTLSNWIKIDTTSTDVKIFVSNRLWNTLNYQGYSMGIRQVSGDNVIETTVYNGSSAAQYRGLGNDLNTGTWYNIVNTFDHTESTVADKFKVYLNGVSISLTQVHGNAPTNFSYGSNFGFGAAEIGGGNEGAYFDGQIGPCQVYNRVLSASEVLFNYNGLKGRFGL